MTRGDREVEPRPFDPLAAVAIPAGTFVMGTPAPAAPEPETWRDDLGHMDVAGAGNANYSEPVNRAETPARTIAISALEAMSQPVTRGLYAEVMGHDPGWPEPTDLAADLPADELADELARLPVTQVTWYQAIAFCNALSERHGLEPCYQGAIDHAGGTSDPDAPGARDPVIWLRRADGYRLPTEAEWEFLCRAGTTTRWSFGDDARAFDAHVWCRANAGGRPHPVGEKTPNPWGLHDMHGNVLEWCWDWYAPYAARPDHGVGQNSNSVLEPVPDPTGPTSTRAPLLDVFDGAESWVRARARVVRGGSFYFAARDLRCAARDFYHPTYRFKDLGFRCVRTLHPTTRDTIDAT